MEKNTQGAEELLDRHIRPKTLDDFIGQEKVKKNLQVLIQAAKMMKITPDHILFYGPPGLGKTTLAYIIAQELGKPIAVTSGPAIERPGDLISILTNLEEGSVFFIDEIHRIPKTLEEVLYPAIEERVVDLTVGKGPNAKTLRIDLPAFVLIGATTKVGALSNPFRDRFGAIYHLDFYQVHEIVQILSRSAKILGLDIDQDSLQYIAERSRMTPRVANRLLKRVRDLAVVKNLQAVDLATTKELFENLEIDDLGLDNTDRRLLQTIAYKYNGGPVGLNSLSATLSEDPTNIEEVIEPYLLRMGLLKRTAQGRVITPEGSRLVKFGLLSFDRLL